MYKRSTALACVGWLAIQTTQLAVADQVLDLGDLDQYSSKDLGPALKDNTVWMSGQDGQNITIAFSSDLQGRIKTSMDLCSAPDDSCFHAVAGLLQGARLEIDARIQPRHFGHLLSKTFKKGLGVVIGVAEILEIPLTFAAITSYLMSDAKMRHDEVWGKGPGLAHIMTVPTIHATQLATISNGVPLTISAAGTAIMTVTPSALPSMTVTGHVKPAITSVSAVTAGYFPGDLKLTMDPALAAGLDEIMRRMTHCSEGSAFDSARRGKRDGASYGKAICGAIGAISMATPGPGGGPLQDILLVGGPQFMFTTGQVADAAQVVIDFVRDYAPLLNVPDDVVENIAHYVFALAIDTLVDNLPLREENPVRQSTIMVTMTTAPACSSTSACEATCEELGVSFYFCETSCGPVTGCATATATGDPEVKTITTIPYGGPAAASAAPTDTAQLAPKCSMDKPGVIPWNVFYGTQFNVANPFCDEVGKNQRSELDWTVDIKGKRVQTRRRTRSPPVKAGDYSDYKVDLRWVPNPGFNAANCGKDCRSTYQAIANGPCGHTGGESNAIATSGSWDIGCGTYEWNVITPNSAAPDFGSAHIPFAVQPQECYTESNFPGHADVFAQDVSLGAAFACGEVPETMNAKSPKWTPEKPMYGHSGYELKFEIEWKAGCVTDVEEQSPRDPLGEKGGTNLCYSLLANNWQACTGNHGVGGYINAGCLTYRFSPGR